MSTKPTTYKGVKIRSRGRGWQVDFGTVAGKRVQRSYQTKEEAKLGIDAHVQQRKWLGLGKLVHEQC